MPRRQEPKKDAVSSEMPRGAVSRHRSVDIRMGQPIWSHIQISCAEHIGTAKASRGTETSKYPEERKENSIPQVAASEKGRAQTDFFGDRGCRTPIYE